MCGGKTKSKEKLARVLQNMRMAQKQTEYRSPERPFKDIFQGKFKQIEQISLLYGCNRMSVIQGDIWVAVFGDYCIHVIGLKERRKREIRFTFRPSSVKEAPWGDIFVASDTGLHVLCPDGTVQSTINSDTFFDVCFFGDEIVGLNGSKRILQTFSRSGDGGWRLSGGIKASEGIGSDNWDSVVTSGCEFLFTMPGNSPSHYYKCLGKTGQRMDFSSNLQKMSLPCVCGVDSTGAVLVADYNNKSFQIHETDDQWSVVSVDPIRTHRLLDFLYDGDTDTVWVLSQGDGAYLTQLDRDQ